MKPIKKNRKKIKKIIKQETTKTKIKEYKDKDKEYPICYVCKAPIKKGLVYLCNNTFRHETCYAGSRKWLINRKKSPFYTHFKEEI